MAISNVRSLALSLSKYLHLSSSFKPYRRKSASRTPRAIGKTLDPFSNGMVCCGTVELLPRSFAEAGKIGWSLFEKSIFPFLAFFRAVIKSICSVGQVLNTPHVVGIGIESLL